jgi:signal transduction histidine kinase
VPATLLALPFRLLTTLVVLVLGVVLVSLGAVRWLTRPLRTLAIAADNLGRNIDQPPLPETGPTEVKRASQAFNTMQRRLKRYLDDRARILAAVSHDLKTPITRLRLRAELMDDAELKQKISDDLDDMETMVSATLDFMRSDGANEQTQPLDMTALVESLVEDARELSWDVQLEGQAERPYAGKPLALKRCLNNLIENAVRYGHAARVVIDDRDDQLRIRVIDQGDGLPEAEMEQVFDPFYRREASRSRHSGGTGLGLGIARNIARAHGGDVTLANHSPRGLMATVTLPRADR